MSSPFILNKVSKGYTVTWPTFHNVQGNPECFNLLKLLFEQIKVDEAMLLLGEDQMVTVGGSLWYSGHGEKYSEWLMAQYNVTGVAFKKINQAEELRDELEKKYIWKVLKL